MYFGTLHQNSLEHRVFKGYEIWTERPVVTGWLLAGS